MKQKSPFGPVYDLFLGPSEPKMAWSVPIWPWIPTLTYAHSKLKHEYDEFDEINEKILFKLHFDLFEPITAVFDLFLA